jgi:hypothetical protein
MRDAIRGNQQRPSAHRVGEGDSARSGARNQRQAEAAHRVGEGDSARSGAQIEYMRRRERG